VLVGLYEESEKPSNAIEFIKTCLGAPSDTDVEKLKAENDELKGKVAELEKKVEELQNELENERANN
jgi:predicted RNase H-like nuclease (RuvC/YqgF family)